MTGWGGFGVGPSGRFCALAPSEGLEHGLGLAAQSGGAGGAACPTTPPTARYGCRCCSRPGRRSPRTPPCPEPAARPRSHAATTAASGAFAPRLPKRDRRPASSSWASSRPHRPGPAPPRRLRSAEPSPSHLLDPDAFPKTKPPCHTENPHREVAATHRPS